MLSVRTPDIADCRNNISLHQTAADNLVSWHIPANAEQDRGVFDGACPTTVNKLQRIMENEAQTDAGHARKE